jgi:hypothetical protein
MVRLSSYPGGDLIAAGLSDLEAGRVTVESLLVSVGVFRLRDSYTGSLLRAVPELKESLSVNIELVSPAHFIPELPGWEGRCQFIAQRGPISFYHYDMYAQALSKLERRHARDLADVEEMKRRKFGARSKTCRLSDPGA